MGTQIFLGLQVLVWAPYGLFCFFQPSYLGEAAGLLAANATASVEIRAMYGGLQFAIGALAAVGLVRPALRPSALVAIIFLCTGLGVARGLGALIDSEMSGYTSFALVFEFASAALALWLLRSNVPATA